jgi:hypothetical protein
MVDRSRNPAASDSDAAAAAKLSLPFKLPSARGMAIKPANPINLLLLLLLLLELLAICKPVL